MKRFFKIARNSSYFFIIFMILSFLTISLYPILFENDGSFSFISRFVYSLFTSLVLLIPSVFYITRKTTGDYIHAVKIEEILISENEMKDAVTTWIFAKYGKPVMGEVEINTSNIDGRITCIANVVQD